MPLKKHKIIRNSAEQEGRILLAISALKKNKISTVTRAAQIFNVPHSTLRD
jgi:predicted HTH domain antitoxin